MISKSEGWEEMDSEIRPWGCFYVLEEKPGFKVKHITVNPGGRLSLQSHSSRCEHWVILSGIATVTVGDKKGEFLKSQSIDIAQGEKHRLENFHTDPLELIEVQFGDHLDESDITRYEDIYQRL